MNFKNLLPLLMPVAELIWGDDDDSSSDSHHDVASEPEDTKMPPIAASASVCLAQIPWLSPECLEPLLTKMTGVGIILGACLNKAPTVANMLKAQSAEGLSRSALYSEALFYANSSLYSILMKHPFTAYGENFVLLIQTLGMVLLMWRFDRVTLLEQFTTTAVAIVYTLGIFWTLPDEFRYVLHGANDLVILYSGGAQVIETYRVQHTGAHSIVTTSMNLIGEVLRVFTTLEETNGDVNMLLSYALCIFLSLTMFVQYFWYRTNTERFFMEQEKKKKE